MNEYERAPLLAYMDRRIAMIVRALRTGGYLNEAEKAALERALVETRRRRKEVARRARPGQRRLF